MRITTDIAAVLVSLLETSPGALAPSADLDDSAQENMNVIVSVGDNSGGKSEAFDASCI